MNRWIRFEVGYYNYRNDFNRPYGTMMLAIQCGIVHISIEIKPQDIKDFITGVLTGKSFKFEGRCDINAGHLNPEIEEFQKDTIVSHPSYYNDLMKESKELEKIFYEFENSTGNRKENVKKFINNLKEFYKID